jgi:cytochrome b6-f complex iron-sulfur subunit
MVGVRRLVADGRQMTRRSFLAVLGGAAFAAASLGALFQSLRFMFPNATNEQPSIFKVDPPSAYAVGSTTVFVDQRVVINRDPDGVYAFNLICTHLGCTPRWFPGDVTSDLIAQGIRGLRATTANPALPGFKCPCHGSRYYRDSVNFYGPAPRPMDHIHVEIARDGRMLVDRASFVDLKFRLKV